MDDGGLARECQMDRGSEAHSELSQREKAPFLSTWRYRDSRAQCSHFTLTHIEYFYVLCPDGQDCIHMFTPGPATLRNLVNIS